MRKVFLQKLFELKNCFIDSNTKLKKLELPQSLPTPNRESVNKQLLCQFS